MNKLEVRPQPHEVAALPGKEMTFSSRLVQSRAGGAAALGELTAASAKTSAGAIDGTGMKRKPY